MCGRLPRIYFVVLLFSKLVINDVQCRGDCDVPCSDCPKEGEKTYFTNSSTLKNLASTHSTCFEDHTSNLRKSGYLRSGSSRFEVSPVKMVLRYVIETVEDYAEDELGTTLVNEDVDDIPTVLPSSLIEKQSEEIALALLANTLRRVNVRRNKRNMY
ncbi:uncharacterized protein LOC143226352 [Tachypleus tridentatus]|uniref:uncharacterized protein LOC143226352 n=1 Tax=Tachypleus tridentatus TaxID=6853 RepID=UPI003FD3DCA3